MRTRTLGKTGFEVSEIGFGAWAIGADWGTVGEEDAQAALAGAADAGVSFTLVSDDNCQPRADSIAAGVWTPQAD